MFKRVFNVFICLIFTVCFFTACNKIDEGKVEVTVKNFMDAMVADNYDAAGSFCKGTARRICEDYSELLGESNSKMTYEIENISIDDDKAVATVNVHVEYMDNLDNVESDDATMKLHLINSDDTWRIYKIETD